MRQWPKPDTEPEIIAPGEMSRSETRIWLSADGQPYRYRRIRVARPGPFGLLLLGMALGAGLLLAIVLLLGAVLIWIPILGLLGAAAILSGIFGRPSRWPR